MISKIEKKINLIYMRSFKEFFYLTRNTSFFDAVFYMFYKFRLKLSNSEVAINNRKNNAAWLEKIYAHLFVYQNKVVKVNGRDLCEVSLYDYNNSKVYLRPLSSDRDVFFQVFGNKDYEPVVDIYNQNFACEPKFIVDLGANIGLTSIYFSKIYKDASIQIVEPYADNAAMAELNLETNRVKNYSVVKGGIWNKNALFRLDKQFRDGKEWSIRLTEDDKGDIKGYCIYEMLNAYNEPIDILKIDIEGAEKKLFENPVYAKDFLRKVKCVAIEIHDEFDCRKLIYDALNTNGFFYFNIKDMTIAINKNYL